MRFKILLFSLLLSACAHLPSKPPPASERLYPDGKYQHVVKIQTQQPEPRTMEMHGVVSADSEKLKVVGLSTFNTTVFRIEENLQTGELKKEFYLDIIKQHEDRFMQFYRLIRALLSARKGQTDFVQEGAHFEITEPDAQRIYRHIRVTHPQFNIDIRVTQYEF